MADSTHFTQAAKEMEDRISQRMDNRFLELAYTLKETLTLSMKDTMQELLTQSRGEGPHGLSNDNMGFGAIGDDPMVELLRLRQKTSVDAYHEEFNSIITRLKLSDDHILRCFLGGLKKEIQMMVRMFRPKSLQHAFTLARTYEGTNSSNSMANIQCGP